MDLSYKQAKTMALMLVDHVSKVGLHRRELKSVAKSIGYPIGLSHKGNRLALTENLATIYASTGVLAMLLAFAEEVTESEDTEEAGNVLQFIQDTYARELVLRWVPDERQSLQYGKVQGWLGSVTNWGNPDEIGEMMANAAADFYAALPNTDEANPMAMPSLMLRFNQYVPLLVESVVELRRTMSS